MLTFYRVYLLCQTQYHRKLFELPFFLFFFWKNKRFWIVYVTNVLRKKTISPNLEKIQTKPERWNMKHLSATRFFKKNYQEFCAIRVTKHGNLLTT